MSQPSLKSFDGGHIPFAFEFSGLLQPSHDRITYQLCAQCPVLKLRRTA